MTDDLRIGKKIEISLTDMDTLSWKRDLESDLKIIKKVKKGIEEIDSQNDLKLNGLIQLIEHKINNPINGNNKKIIIFSHFEDTANYLYEHVSKHFLDKHKLYSACIIGSNKNKKNLDLEFNGMNDLLSRFSPVSKNQKEKFK